MPSGALQLIGEVLPNLQNLLLNGVETDWDDLQHLPPTLQELVLRSCPGLKNEHLAVVCRMEQLQILHLFDHCHSGSSDGLSSVSEFKLKNLVKLNLQGTGADETLLATISATSSRLEELTISDRRSATGAIMVTDLGVSSIAQVQSLKHLTLFECDHITNQSMVFLSQLSSLEELRIYCCKNTDLDGRCLRSIGEMRSLKELHFLENHYILPTDEDFSQMGNLTSLKELLLCNFRSLTDVSLKVIGALRCIEKLDISNCTGFTDDGLVHLAALPGLRKLDCNYEDEVGNDEIMQITLAGLTLYGLSNYLVDCT